MSRALAADGRLGGCSPSAAATSGTSGVAAATFPGSPFSTS
jgi:hypothetical protein